MNMKAQGLPINFIVLAAIAILILILVVGFVIGGGTSFSRSISPTMARQNCESACANMQKIASTKSWEGTAATDQWTALYGSTVVKANKPFCAPQQYQGQTVAAGENCNDIGVTCFVTFSDGVQKEMKCGA